MEEFRGSNKDILNCLQTAVIKRQKELEYYDTQEYISAFNKYRNAYNHTDTVYEYEYTVADYNAIGLTDRDTIIKINQDIRSMSLYLSETQMDKLLENKRQEIIDEYKEKNRYVLTLMGHPYREKDYIYVGYHVEGVRDDIPIHEMTDGEITVLVNRGILNEIIASNPDIEYLRFMTRRIDFYTTRTSEQFGLLYINTTDYTVGYQVAEVYEYTRLGFMRTVYNEVYNETYDFYEALMGAYLISAVMFTIIAENPMSILEFDFTSDDILDSLYKTFSIPYVEDLPKSTRIAFAEKLNRVLVNKGNKQSIIDIADAFGIKDVFQYVLYKEYADAEKGYDPNKSLEENYKLYFIRVPIRESDIHKYIYSTKIDDEKNKIPFADFVAEDKRWGLDNDNLQDFVMRQDFSYMTTKYIGVDTVIDLVGNAMRMTEFMSFLFSNKKSLGNLSLTLNRPVINATIWESFIYCIILLINMNGYEDNIVKDAEGTVYIYGMDSMDEITPELVKEYKKYLPTSLYYLLEYKTVSKTMNMTQFMEVLLHNHNTLEALRDTIKNWNGDYFLLKYLIKLEHLVSRMKINKYYGDIAKYNTYSEWLMNTNLELYTRLEAIRYASDVESEMYEELLSVIDDLERYCNPNNDPEKSELLGFLSKIREDEAQTVKTTMFKMITFLKSYTVDMRIPKLTLYTFDDYTKIMSEVIIKNQIWLWSRVTTIEDCAVTVKATSLKSMVEIFDQFHEVGVRDRSHVKLPPWVTVPDDFDYLRPDISVGSYDDGGQTWYAEYDHDLVEVDGVEDWWVKYKVYLNDVTEPLVVDDTFMSYYFEIDHSYLDITDTLEILDTTYSWSRVNVLYDIIKKLSPERYCDDSVMTYDTLKSLDTGRMQTDIYKLQLRK